MTKAQLRKAKAELKRLEAIIAAANPKGSLNIVTKPDPVHGNKGYVLVVPDWDDSDLMALLRKGPQRLSWGDQGRGHPRWQRDLGAYRVLKSALPK